MTKPPSPAFQPAPRPRPLVSPEQAQNLAAGTGDLGFTRPSNAPAPANQVPETPSASEPKKAKPQAAKGPRAQEDKSTFASKSATLKFEIPDSIWAELRHAAVERRVTVKYLVLEALAEKGYKVDLSAIPEDGRRNR